MSFFSSQLVQRPFNYCIIDEVDSILIDEARTPLIISGQVPTDSNIYIQAAEISKYLTKNIHFEIDEGTGIFLTRNNNSYTHVANAPVVLPVVGNVVTIPPGAIKSYGGLT